MLIGRQREAEAIDSVLARARVGEAAALVLVGEPGVGKTALLRYALERADGMTVVRATGIETEADLEYSGLLEICRPLLDELDALPEKQANALRVALGLADGEAPDRFGVAAATLGVLAAAAERRPVLVIVDDVQWLDQVSADAILFAARRLLADRVAFLLTARTDGFEAQGLAELRLTGLGREDAAQLIARTVGAVVPDAVVDALFAATGGNPLALLELPAGLHADQLDGSEPLTGPLPVTAAIERAFAGRLELLPLDARRALGVLAAATTDDLDPALRALDALGLGSREVAAAEDAGLVTVESDRFRFQHPLLRAVAYAERPPSEHRLAHRALADALAAPAEVERRAWHLAAAAVGQDDAAADALAEAAALAIARGAHGAAAKALERAARLTSDPALRLRRLTEAADAAWSGGNTAWAAAIATEVLASDPDVGVRARLVYLLGRIEFFEGRQDRARELFLQSAALLEPSDPPLATRVLGFAAFTCHNEGRVHDAVELMRGAREVAASSGNEDAVLDAEYVLGRSLLLSGRADEGAPLLESVLERLRERSPERLGLTRIAVALLVLGRTEEAEPPGEQAVALGREEGPLVLAQSLSVNTAIAVRHGDWRRAEAAATEGLELARQLAHENAEAIFLNELAYVHAVRGEELAFHEVAERAAAHFERSGSVDELERLRCSRGLLELALDRLPAAIQVLEQSASAVHGMKLCDRDVSPEPDLVEALVRAGRPDEATGHLERWLSRGTTNGTPWGPPLEARCRALVAEDDAFAALFEESLALHAALPDRFQQARTHLLYGQRLRRASERRAAREQLRAALELFEALEAEPWAERARQELRASGAKLRKAAESGDELTPQELQIALQVAEGKANKEVAAAMFLSTKTVEFHLSRIYRKLGITSRAELVRRYASELAITAS